MSGGANTVAPAPGPRGAERRTQTRYVVRELAGVLHGQTELLAVLTDISAGGAMLEGDLPFANGTRITLAFGEFTDLPARVAHAGTGFCGVQFLHDGEQRLSVVNWIRRRALERRRQILAEGAE